MTAYKPSTKGSHHMSAPPKNSIPIEVLDAAIRGWFGTVPETKDQQQHFRHRVRTALIAAQWTGPAAGDARDAERLDFLVNYGAWIDWAKDREYCRVYRCNDEGFAEPMTGWESNYLTTREAIDAAIAAQRGKGG
jgi:hypothetical protein